MHTLPGPTGLYGPRFQHDSCGVSFVANIKGVASHDLVLTGLVPDEPPASRRQGGRADTATAPAPSSRSPTASCGPFQGGPGVELPLRGRLCRRHGLPPRGRRRREGAGRDRGDRRRRGHDRRRPGATSPSDPTASGRPRGRRCRRSATLSSADPGRETGIDLDRRRSSPANESTELDVPSWPTYFPSPSVAHVSRTRGC